LLKNGKAVQNKYLWKKDYCRITACQKTVPDYFKFLTLKEKMIDGKIEG
jgi:hypothetical protein